LDAYRESIRHPECKNEEQATGLDILRRAIEAPLRFISENAGIAGSIIISKPEPKGAVRSGDMPGIMEVPDQRLTRSDSPSRGG
jgi:hypothetical protein